MNVRQLPDCDFSQLTVGNSYLISNEYSEDEIVSEALEQNIKVDCQLSMYEAFVVTRIRMTFSDLVRRKLQLAVKDDYFPCEIPICPDMNHSVNGIRVVASRIGLNVKIKKRAAFYLVDLKSSKKPDWLSKPESLLTPPSDILFSSFVARIHREALEYGVSVKTKREGNALHVTTDKAKPLTNKSKVTKWLTDLPFNKPTPIPNELLSKPSTMVLIYKSGFTVQVTGNVLTKYKLRLKKNTESTVGVFEGDNLILTSNHNSVAELKKDKLSLSLLCSELIKIGYAKPDVEVLL